MEERTPTRGVASPVKRSPGPHQNLTPASAPGPGLASPRGALIESLRRRHVQAELQLREMEDRFRRDCARQEQELELLRIDNNKHKAKIEELRMAQTASGETAKAYSGVAAATAASVEESKLLKASSRRYRAARNAVDKAREELIEVQVKLASTRQRMIDVRKQRVNTRVKARLSSVEASRTRAVLDIQSQASRLQLRGIEYHVETETDRASKLIEEAKAVRNEIDVQLNVQNRIEDLYREREEEMMEIMKETSFLIEVCNLLFEERDDCQQQLAEMRRASESDHDAYEKMFHELVAVEERDKTIKVKLRENISKLKEEIAEVAKERMNTERAVQEENAAINNSNNVNDSGRTGDVDDDDDEGGGLARQLQEFERYLSRLSDLAGSSALPDVENFVCGGGEERFRLYAALHRTQEEIAKFERQREVLQEAAKRASEGNPEERRAREELQNLQLQLKQAQRDIMDHEQQGEFVKAHLDAVIPLVQSIFEGLECDDTRIIATRGISVLSRETLELYLAAIEQRLEEYMAAWGMKEHLQEQEKLELSSANVKGERIYIEKSKTQHQQISSEVVRNLVNGRMLNGNSTDVNSSINGNGIVNENIMR